MFKIMSASETVDLIKDGDCIVINSFLTLSNPEKLSLKCGCFSELPVQLMANQNQKHLLC